MTDKPFKVHHKQFEYSPFLRSAYTGLWLAAPAIFMLGPVVFSVYTGSLLFLGLGLRTLLQRTGLYRSLSHYLVVIEDKSYERFEGKRAAEIDRKVRDDRHRKRRLKHPDLPKNW